MKHVSSDQEDDGPVAAMPTIAGAVLAEFFDTLEAMKDFADIAPVFRTTVLGDGIFAEAAIRKALFGNST